MYHIIISLWGGLAVSVACLARCMSKNVEVPTGLVRRNLRTAMGTRKQREKQEDISIAYTELASTPGHPFYQRLNELLEAQGFDEVV